MKKISLLVLTLLSNLKTIREISSNFVAFSESDCSEYINFTDMMCTNLTSKRVRPQSSVYIFHKLRLRALFQLDSDFFDLLNLTRYVHIINFNLFSYCVILGVSLSIIKFDPIFSMVFFILWLCYIHLLHFFHLKK